MWAVVEAFILPGREDRQRGAGRPGGVRELHAVHIGEIAPIRVDKGFSGTHRLGPPIARGGCRVVGFGKRRRDLLPEVVARHARGERIAHAARPLAHGRSTHDYALGILVNRLRAGNHTAGGDADAGKLTERDGVGAAELRRVLRERVEGSRGTQLQLRLRGASQQERAHGRKDRKSEVHKSLKKGMLAQRAGNA